MFKVHGAIALSWVWMAAMPKTEPGASLASCLPCTYGEPRLVCSKMLRAWNTRLQRHWLPIVHNSAMAHALPQRKRRDGSRSGPGNHGFLGRPHHPWTEWPALSLSDSRLFKGYIDSKKLPSHIRKYLHFSPQFSFLLQNKFWKA